MAQFFAIHPDSPQERLVKQAADIIRKGGIAVYPPIPVMHSAANWVIKPQWKRFCRFAKSTSSTTSR